MSIDVAVTGLGAVTALGGDVAALAAALLDGRCGIGALTLFAYVGRCRIAAQVPEPVPATLDDGALPRATARRLSRPDRFGLIAARQACRQAGLDPTTRRGAAVFVGASVGGMRDTEEAWGRRRRDEDTRFRLSQLLGTPISTTAGVVGQALGAFGPRATFSTACSSSALALGEAAAAIRRGQTPVAIVVGADALCRLTYAGFDALQALDPEPCRPFAADRGGLSLGEGGAALVLEDLAHARARGARPLAIVLGCGTATDAHHVTAPHPEGVGAETALRSALASGGVPAAAVDYVNAHGTGTRQNDAMEVGVLRRVFGDRVGGIPISSSKAQLGHCLAAAGAVEAVVTVLAVDGGVLPPTANLRTPDPAWADLDLVRTPGRRQPVEVAVSSSYGFGGHNVSLVFGRPR